MSSDHLSPPTSSESTNSNDKLEPEQGQIAKIIGSGNNAQNSIVYKTISWSFLSAIILSIVVFIYIAYKGIDNPLDSLKIVWSIFIPLITLSLGYIFGKTK